MAAIAVHLHEISKDINSVAAECTNKLIGYLAAVSRKLTAPLAVVVQSASAAGKSSLLDVVLAFMPEEERIRYSAMTQRIDYMQTFCFSELATADYVARKRRDRCMESCQ